MLQSYLPNGWDLKSGRAFNQILGTLAVHRMRRMLGYRQEACVMGMPHAHLLAPSNSCTAWKTLHCWQ